MNKIERMLQELCPEGVEYKKLIDVAEILYGYPFDAKLFTEDNQYIPLIRIRDVKSAKASTYYKGDFNDIYIIKRGDILVGMDGNFNLEKWNDRNGVLNQRVCKIYAKNQLVVINEYLYHLLGPIFKKIEEEVKGGTVKHLSAAKINRIEIPVPPLPIQEEIVRILDHFTELTASLQAELQARQEQYEYYRNKLLTFDAGSVTWMKMSEIGEICMCKRIMKHQTNSNSGIPFYKIGTFGKKADAYISNELYEEYKKNYSFPRKGEILISASGTIGRTIIYDGKPAYFQDSNIIWISNDESKVFNKFLYYYFQIAEWKTEGGAIKRLYNANLAKMKIAVPPLSDQQHIINILDKFETLANDLFQGLPAEIAAVQEQYEYYRNKLLTFNSKMTN